MKEAAIKIARQYFPPGVATTVMRKGYNFYTAFFLSRTGNGVSGVVFGAMMLFCACRPAHTEIEATHPVYDTIGYEVDNVTATGITITRCEAVISSQKVYISTTVTRGFWKGGIPEPYLWELHSVAGNRSLPVEVHWYDDQDAVRVELVYEPVHSRELFHLCGLRGDIDEAYTLVVPSSQEKSSILLTVNRAQLLSGVKRFGLAASATPFRLSMDEMFEASVHDHLALLPSINRSSSHHSFHLADNELLIDGVWLKVESYHRYDTLRATIRLVNQSMAELSIDLGGITLLGESGAFRPSVAQVPMVRVPSGGRSQFQLKFACKKQAFYKLNLESVQFLIEGRNYQLLPMPVKLESWKPK